MKRPIVNDGEGGPIGTCSGDSGDASAGTSSELLRQARAHNQDAWTELVDRYSRRMYRWCRRSGLQSADAANVVQESLHAVARKLEDFRRDRPGDTFRGWLRRIVDNKVRDHYRRAGRTTDRAAGGSDAAERMEQLADDPDAEPTWDTSMADPMAAPRGPVVDAISTVRDQVTPRDWRIFWRTAVDGQSSSEVAEEFQVTANAVRLVKMRVLRRLREQVGELNLENR